MDMENAAQADTKDTAPEEGVFSFDIALEHLKDAGSLGAWKKNHKEEHDYWVQSESFSDLKSQAGLTKPVKKKTAVVQPIKANISSPEALALNEILKDRGLKKLDISEVLDEALSQVPEAWWEAKKEELTPLEWKVEQIAKDPQLKSKLESQLDELLASAKNHEVH